MRNVICRTGSLENNHIMIYSQREPTAPRCRLFLFFVKKVLDKSVLLAVNVSRKRKESSPHGQGGIS